MLHKISKNMRLYRSISRMEATLKPIRLVLDCERIRMIKAKNNLNNVEIFVFMRNGFKSDEKVWIATSAAINPTELGLIGSIAP